MKKIQIAIINLIAIMLVIAMISTLASVEAKTEETTHGVITISFDDGIQSQFDYAYPLMKARGIVGTFYAITDSISDFSGDKTYMSISELQTLQANGNEIGSHSKTHSHFTELTEDQIRQECTISKSILQSYGLSAINFAYPYGDRDARTDAIVSQYYSSGRSTSLSISPMTLPATTWLIVGTAGDNEQPNILSLLKNFADQVYASNEWGVVYFHNITPSATTDTYSTSQQDFESFLDYIISKEIPTKTVNQVQDPSTPPTTPLSASINPTSATMEIGQSQKFTSAVTGGSQPYSYQWYLNGIAITGANSNTWTFTPTVAGHYNIYLNVKDSHNQQAQSNIVDDIMVYAQLSILVSPSSANTTLGRLLQLNSTVTGGLAPYNYQWYYTNGTAITGATVSTLTYKANSTGATMVYLKVTDNLNSKALSNNATFNIYPQPSVAITSSSLNMISNGSQQFTSNVTGGIAPYTYQWYQNGTAISGANSNILTFNPTTAGKYIIYLKIIDKSTTASQSNNVTVEVTSPPAETLATQGDSSFTFFNNWGLYLLASLLVTSLVTARVVYSKSISKSEEIGQNDIRSPFEKQASQNKQIESLPYEKVIIKVKGKEQTRCRDIKTGRFIKKPEQI